MAQETRKPSHKEWLDWAQVLMERLTTCVHTYSKPPHADVFITEKERTSKNEQALTLLRRLHTLIDDSDTPTESLSEVAHHDEQVIDGIAVLFAEALTILPVLSTDMQKLLKSEWFDKCNGRLASELFRGPLGDVDKGIGSGYPEQGRLPAILAELLERERTGDPRAPRKELHRHGDKAGTMDEGGDLAPRRSDLGMRSRWSDKVGR